MVRIQAADTERNAARYRSHPICGGCSQACNDTKRGYSYGGTCMSLVITFVAVARGAGIWLAILRYYDRIEPESVRDLLMVGIVGGLVSVLMAAGLNEVARWQLGLGLDLFDPQPSTSLLRLALFCLFVGLVEEALKAMPTVYSARYMGDRSEEHTSELQSRGHLVCRLLLEKKKT